MPEQWILCVNLWGKQLPVHLCERIHRKYLPNRWDENNTWTMISSINVNGKINRNSDYAGFQAKRSKCISAKLGFWSAILFWLITKIKPGLSSTCNWRRVAISSLVYKKSCVERIFQGEDLLGFPARIFNTLKFFTRIDPSMFYHDKKTKIISLCWPADTNFAVRGGLVVNKL